MATVDLLIGCYVVILLSHAEANVNLRRIFKGEGTYYGQTGGAGNCALNRPVPSQYRGLTPIAMNNAQYRGACGACVEIIRGGPGRGATPIRRLKGYVADRCPECKRGDLDLARRGDGRWKITWKFIRCPGGRIEYKFEGSNSYYIKIQPRGTKVPPARVTVNGRRATFTQDNFWEVHARGGPFPKRIRVVTKTIDNRVISHTVRWKSNGVSAGHRRQGGRKRRQKKRN